jgi:iron(III) transport system ATP-binding protein
MDGLDDTAAAAGLRLTGVSHSFGATAVVRNISLTVDRGAIVCLLGPSGCGKTTLLRLAAGLERLQRGRIEIGGHVVADAATGRNVPPESRRVGLMFQDYALFPHLTVGKNVGFGLGRAARNEVWLSEALSRLGLRSLSDAYPHTLSGGQQQRCALLRALAPHPDLLLLDEPFSGLDVTLRAQVREETAAFLREARISTLVVTHDPEEAMLLADQLLVMRDGAIVQQGTPPAIYLHPADPFVAGLFGPLNRWTAKVSGGHIDTPIGAIAAAGLADGAEAVVLIRPEGIVVDRQGQGATVVESRLLGCFSAVTVVPERAPWALRALVAGLFLPAPGTEVGVAADPQQTFVFQA